MKAIRYTKYGSPDVLQVQEVEKPVPRANEVLIKVHAASVNYSDWAFVRGKPWLVRLFQGLFKPKHKILGADMAGQIESMGTDARQFQPGDEVYGDLSSHGWSGFAEYVSVPENALALKPTNLTFEEAAAVPQAALVALQALRDKGQIQPGHRVLIVGASGGIGTFAVQIAKSFDAEVTGVCSTRNLDMVRSIGADYVIDYTKEDFTQNEQTYDLIVATAGYRSVFDYRQALSPKGICVVTGGSMAQIFQSMLVGPCVSMIGTQKVTNLSVKLIQEDLVFMKELLEDGKVVPVIDRQYLFSEVAEAIRYYGEGHARGKVVITLANTNKT